MDKVYAERNLEAAFEKVRSNKGSAGVDHQTVEMFAERRGENLRRIHEQFKEGRYQPQKIKRKMIPKPGKRNEMRPLGIPTVRDRTVQAALRNVIEPIFENEFAEHSYGFRPGRGCKDALRRVDYLLKEGYTWVVDADLKIYFDTIPHDKLIELIQEKIADSRVIDLIKIFLKQEVMDGMETWKPEQGTPQGAIISPLLSNIYLDPLDKLMQESGYEMVRYADDFVILCKTEQQAHCALKQVKTWTEQAQLTLHPEKTKIVDATKKGGFDFLGYHFERGDRWPRKKSIRNSERQYEERPSEQTATA